MAINYAPAPAKHTPKAVEPVAPKPAKKSRKGIGGRPRKADKLVAVTLRIEPHVLAKWQGLGPDWRKRAAASLSALSLE